MINKIPVKLTEEDTRALAILAKREYRDIPQQAAAIIRECLVSRGLLPKSSQLACDPEKADAKGGCL
jgi:hypothetical protein